MCGLPTSSSSCQSIFVSTNTNIYFTKHLLLFNYIDHSESIRKVFILCKCFVSFQTNQQQIFIVVPTPQILKLVSHTRKQQKGFSRSLVEKIGAEAVNLDLITWLDLKILWENWRKCQRWEWQREHTRVKDFSPRGGWGQSLREGAQNHPHFSSLNNTPQLVNNPRTMFSSHDFTTVRRWGN